ncbi:magnesium/cobalt transporter CorA [Paenibacillus roseipurpureus]|uniref:Magnesium transport protein CorA n=1 Tax=Paenibacillus roseopurpureus TaxID=2918901 RepID=A0AA96LR28_9BACL|nr:magnesium/cobalt transporter CorA [Paenibacillus sp. MBLB1832]WNR45687.1 magnesium/cobalt transporter CorA [Paenibacillus sp. MBLB1832]
MIRTLAVKTDYSVVHDLTLKELHDPSVLWYWVDFHNPNEQEASKLKDHFHFHPLAIEDCFYLLQRPKIDHYADVDFFVMHAINSKTLEAEEVDMFLGKNYIVTFHLHESREIEDAWSRITAHENNRNQGQIYAVYLVLDNLVDQYFPSVYQIEDQLDVIENSMKAEAIETLMNEVFEIRSQLLQLRRTIVPMRDLLYRLISTERIEQIREHLVFFTDIHDHLLKLSEMLDSNREITADIRDSYISLNSNRMNNIMKTLTVITTIFMPLTFIAGLYGMNFTYMPELHWHWGYYTVLLLMIAIGLGMFAWFQKKGWFK